MRASGMVHGRRFGAPFLALALAISAGNPQPSFGLTLRPAPPEPLTIQTPTYDVNLLFVHGLSASRTNVEYDDAIGPLLSEYTSVRVHNFQYIQDRGDEDSPGMGCGRGARPPSIATPNDDMPIDLNGSDGDACDSQSDIALNAVALDNDVAELYANSGKPVVLVEQHGRGDRTGFLTYSRRSMMMSRRRWSTA